MFCAFTVESGYILEVSFLAVCLYKSVVNQYIIKEMSRVDEINEIEVSIILSIRDPFVLDSKMTRMKC